MGQKLSLMGNQKRYSELNENENKTHQNSSTAKAVLKGILSINAYTRKKKRSQISNLSSHLMIWAIKSSFQNKLKWRRKSIIKIRTELKDGRQKNNRDNQQNKQLVLWKGQQKWKTSSKNTDKTHKLPIPGMKQRISPYWKHQEPNQEILWTTPHKKLTT